MNLRLNNVRFSYLNVYTPRAMKGAEETDEKGNDKRKFSASLIFNIDQPEHKAVREAIESVAKEQWGQKADGVLKKLYTTGKVALKDGNSRLGPEGEVLDGYEGRVFVNASSPADKPPRVFNRFGQKVTAETRGLFSGEQRGPLSGDYGQALVQFWAQDNQYGQRINCTLLGVSVTTFGEPLGRREMTDEDVASQFTFAEPQGIMEE